MKINFMSDVQIMQYLIKISEERAKEFLKRINYDSNRIKS